MLRAHKHLTKKELKKDPFLIFIAQATEYFQREWMKIGSIVLAVVVVIAGVNFIVHNRTNSEVSAYNNALAAFYANAPEATDLLNQYAEKYRGSKRAQRVLLQLANSALTAGNYQAAREYYERCADNVTDDQIFAFNALNGLGAVSEEMGNYQDAATSYERFVSSYPNSPFVNMMKLNAAKAYYLAGDSVSAKTYFTALASEEVDDSIYQEALYYLELLS